MEQRESTRKEFLTTTAGVAGAAFVGAMGFSRLTGAQENSSMITQTATFKLNPEKADEAIAVLSELCKAVEAKEPGVLAYILHRGDKDPNEVIFFEVYKDQEALAAHGTTEHLGKLRTGFGSLFMPPVTITKINRVAGFAR